MQRCHVLQQSLRDPALIIYGTEHLTEKGRAVVCLGEADWLKVCECVCEATLHYR